MTHSDSISKLAPALVAFGSEVTNPANSAVNPFHKNRYAPLNAMLTELRPLLAKHGLTITQLPASRGDAVGVTTIVLHESGEYITETVTMDVGTEKGKSAAQVAGSIITYLRRYALAAALNIASEDDDDGNAGMRQQVRREPNELEKLGSLMKDVLADMPKQDAAKYRAEGAAAYQAGDIAKLRNIIDAARAHEGNAYRDKEPLSDTEMELHGSPEYPA
jgi:hypothetical protein